MKKNKVKKEKLVSARKLPGIFKKTYSPKKIENKIYKKIFIPADLELIKSIFEPHPKKQGKLFVPRDKQISKRQLKKFKAIAKEIKRQRSLRFNSIWNAVAIVSCLRDAYCGGFTTDYR